MILNDENMEVDSPLNAEFKAAADNPQDFDFAFNEQRESTGFANFGFDPATAEQMRLEEQQRIEQEQTL